ncbi:MAG: transposase [Planctomycetaceae bacterium]
MVGADQVSSEKIAGCRKFRGAAVVIKAECHTAGINRRAVVTNRPGALILPQGAYDEYVQRGESENRNKELKIDMCGERLTDHRCMANQFRLLLHAVALHLIVRLRRALPEASSAATAHSSLHSTSSSLRKLRQAQPATWRQRMIKVAAEVTVSCRRVLIRLSSAWPGLSTWKAVLQTLQRR